MGTLAVAFRLNAQLFKAVLDLVVRFLVYGLSPGLKNLFYGPVFTSGCNARSAVIRRVTTNESQL